MTAPAAVVAGPAAVAVAGAWFFPWLVAAIAYYHSVSIMGKKSWLPPPTAVELTGPQNIEKCTHVFYFKIKFAFSI